MTRLRLAEGGFERKIAAPGFRAGPEGDIKLFRGALVEVCPAASFQSLSRSPIFPTKQASPPEEVVPHHWRH